MDKSENYALEAETLHKLIETLQGVPGLDACERIVPLASHGGRKIDAEIEFKAGGRRYCLLVEIKKSFVYPRDALQTYWQLSGHMTSIRDSYQRRQVVPLLAAKSISLGARNFLKGENCGFFDTGGSLFVPARGVHVYIEKPPPKTFRKSVHSVFKGSRSQVLYVLLFRHNEWFSVKNIAEFAGVSPATASETLSAIEHFDWLDVKGTGPSKERKLINPRALLDEWKKQIMAMPRRRALRRFYVSANSDEIARRFADICERLDIKYVLTAQSAAQIYTPFLTSVAKVTYRLAFNRYMNELYAALEARIVNEGYNLEVIEGVRPSEFLFMKRVNSIWLANPVQVYLDLLRNGGRSNEMAEHLRRERIGF